VANYDVILLLSHAPTAEPEARPTAEPGADSVPLPTESELAVALEHTRDWEGARAALPQAGAALRVREPLISPERLPPLVARVAALAASTPCLALWWTAADKLVAPAQLAGEVDPLRVAVNLRHFHVEEGRSGETVVDTRGLDALGLPDLQCHFVGLEPSVVAELLWRVARYLYEEGAVIEDGDAVTGPDDGEWRCRWEESLVDPPRDLLDIAPPAPYSAR
jgi:hypothetical protein